MTKAVFQLGMSDSTSIYNRRILSQFAELINYHDNNTPNVHLRLQLKSKIA